MNAPCARPGSTSYCGTSRRAALALIHPTLFAEQRHEADGAEILLLEGIAAARDHLQVLVRIDADRDDEAPSFGEFTITEDTSEPG